jgi:hypothetical protein
MTNAEKIAADIDGLADLIYRADDINPEICNAEYGEGDDLVNCKYPDEDKGCVKCIKEWLMEEVSKE